MHIQLFSALHNSMSVLHDDLKVGYVDHTYTYTHTHLHTHLRAHTSVPLPRKTRELRKINDLKVQTFLLIKENEGKDGKGKRGR